jgi:hypothetical protein
MFTHDFSGTQTLISFLRIPNLDLHGGMGSRRLRPWLGLTTIPAERSNLRTGFK